jgi:mono/diheme cytochrome c family protein
MRFSPFRKIDLRPLPRLLSAFILVLPALASAAEEILEEFEELTPAGAMEAPAPDPARIASGASERVVHGRYLVELLGCGTCHTDGALIGLPNESLRLAGSRTGIAYSNPLEYEHPGVVYPPNLTPDEQTGIGAWSDEELIRMIRSGVDRHGKHHLAIMPFPAFGRLSDDDLLDIVTYLRSLPPIKHQVPAAVERGEEATAPYVHFGVYRSRR